MKVLMLPTSQILLHALELTEDQFYGIELRRVADVEDIWNLHVVEKSADLDTSMDGELVHEYSNLLVSSRLAEPLQVFLELLDVH